MEKKVRVMNISDSVVLGEGFSEILLENEESFVSLNDLVKKSGLVQGAEVDISGEVPEIYYSHGGIILHVEEYI